MTTVKLLRGQPPSPPQSPNGASSPDSQLEPCMAFNPAYTHPESMRMNGHSTMKIAYDSDPQPLAYTSTPAYYMPNSDYSRMLPMQHPIGHPGFQVNTPPPAADEGMIPGSLGSTPPSWTAPKSSLSGKARVSRPPKQRRAKKMKERSKYKTTVPLSESTKDLTHIPIRDMESWVHRPIKARMQEVAKRNGRVARPMNSFMLYRSAYAERAKELHSQNNHQVVSETAGDSWKLESRTIREKYEYLATIEKNNHLQAHPGYKFSPSKKDKQPEEEHSEPDTNQEASSMPSPSFIQGGRGMSCGGESSSWDSRDFTPFDQDHGLPSASYLSSSWQTSHPGRPFGMVSSPEPATHCLSSSILPGGLSMQEMQYSSSTALAGLPGGTHHDLLQPQTSIPTPGSYTEGQLDPQLLKRDTASPTQIYHNGPYPSIWQDGNCYMPATTSIPSNPVLYPVPGYQPGMQTLLDSREPWESSQETSIEGPGGDFEHWINPHPTGY